MHLTRILLEALEQGKVSAELGLEILIEHSVATCAACAEDHAAHERAAGRAPGAALLEPRDPVARIGREMRWDAGKLKDEVRAARRQVREIVRLEPRRRGSKIRGASSRYQGPLFGAMLLAEARRRIPGEPAEALALAEAALVSSQNTRVYPTDPAIQAAALAVAGNARRALGRLREGEADLLQARELLHAPGLRDPALPAEVHWYLGALRKDQGKLEEAARHLRRAGTLYELLEEPEKAAKVLLTLAGVHYRAHAFDAAVVAAGEALELLPPDSEAWLRTSAHFNRAYYLHARGDLDRAEAELSAHEDLLVGEGDWGAQHVAWLRARIAWSRDDFRSAERLYTEARKRALERGIAWDAGLVGLELALVHLVQGRTPRVKTLALEALRIFAEQDVEREIQAALDLLEAAARREALTRELLERAIASLERARHARPAAGGRDSV
jgi:tetratricopeptide (TPR) repeat protein